jgi:serine/threonine-protein kinase HipA
MRQAVIKFNDRDAGILTEDEGGYHFIYHEHYLNSALPVAISKTLPLQKTAFNSKILFPFFDGLIPEGWLLDIAEKNWKLNSRDRMGLLLACCKDCIGAVSVHPLTPENDD